MRSRQISKVKRRGIINRLKRAWADGACRTPRYAKPLQAQRSRSFLENFAITSGFRPTSLRKTSYSITESSTRDRVEAHQSIELLLLCS